MRAGGETARILAARAPIALTQRRQMVAAGRPTRGDGVMGAGGGTGGGTGAGAAARDARLKAALRENLRKRKLQGRDGDGDAPEPPAGGDGAA